MQPADSPTSCACPQYAFNLFSHTTKVGDNGYNEEEMKMVKETRKIWGAQQAGASLPHLPSHAARPLSLSLCSSRSASQRARGVCFPGPADDDCFTHQLQT